MCIVCLSLYSPASHTYTLLWCHHRHHLRQWWWRVRLQPHRTAHSQRWILVIRYAHLHSASRSRSATIGTGASSLAGSNVFIYANRNVSLVECTHHELDEFQIHSKGKLFSHFAFCRLIRVYPLSIYPSAFLSIFHFPFSALWHFCVSFLSTRGFSRFAIQIAVRRWGSASAHSIPSCTNGTEWNSRATWMVVNQMPRRRRRTGFSTISTSTDLCALRASQLCQCLFVICH